MELLCSYRLRTVAELKQSKPPTEDCCVRIEGLEIYDGYHCLQPSCGYSTRVRAKVEAHMLPVHGLRAKEHKLAPLWKECLLQTYFTAKGRIDYFVVVDEGAGRVPGPAGGSEPLTEPERVLFAKLERDYADVKGDIDEQASIVHDFGDSRSERVPWLETTGFPHHLATLQDEEIWSSYKLPPKRELDADMEDAKPPDLVRILVAAEAVLRDAYQLCSDTSPDRKMTQQRANILNEFYAGASGKADGFRYFKNASTLVTYFTTMKQLLAYYYRVVHCENGHFTRARPDQKLPGDVIQPTTQQTQAMDEIVEALALEDGEEARLALKHAVRRLYLALICQVVGSVPFRSPVLSFCAMLGRKVRGKGRGLWEEPGNFNSHLSALTWTAQLIIFDYACFQEQDDEDQIPVLLAKICKKFFQQLAETPFGHILQWRLYLFKVGKAAVAKHQARWRLDGQTVEYRGVELQMSHVSDLIRSEYQQAYTLLYDELMFQARDLIPMESWRLKDDLDLEDFGCSWLSHHGNSEFLDGAELALFRRIQEKAELRAMFLTAAVDGSAILCPKAMAIYEAHAQDFLKRVLVLCHIPPGPPLREPELLSVMWRNTARQRHLLIWEKLVMIYTQYHKGQQQSGVYKDNIVRGSVT
jgi:hypothetical protein